MSDVSTGIHKARTRLAAWFAKQHPGDTEIQAIAAEAKEDLAGLEGAAQDVPALVSDAEKLAVDGAHLAADIAMKALNLADVVAAGKDAAQAWADVQKACADFQASRAAAKATSS